MWRGGTVTVESVSTEDHEHPSSRDHELLYIVCDDNTFQITVKFPDESAVVLVLYGSSDKGTSATLVSIFGSVGVGKRGHWRPRVTSQVSHSALQTMSSVLELFGVGGRIKKTKTELLFCPCDCCPAVQLPSYRDELWNQTFTRRWYRSTMPFSKILLGTSPCLPLNHLLTPENRRLVHVGPLLFSGVSCHQA